MTGTTPAILEPRRPADTGCYGYGGMTAAQATATGAHVFGYGSAGGWGCAAIPGQVFVTVTRNPAQGVPLVAGYGSAPGGYSTPSRLSWTSAGQAAGQITDADIYGAIAAVQPAGVTAWVRITT